MVFIAMTNKQNGQIAKHYLKYNIRIRVILNNI